MRRAELILRTCLPEIRNHDHAIQNLYFVDPNNDTTRLHSIAAALYIIAEERGTRGGHQ
jgi:hypothetical protein